ncbi:MAG TPA: STAS domain-containing protein [Mycobacteriales bacterium]|nr:STAS domain-containing protein [Mycobacteriales bacterium]
MRLAERVRAQDHLVVVAPARVDASNAHEFRLALYDALERRASVIVDLSGVEQLHAAGAAVLVGAARRALVEGVALGLRGVSSAAATSLTRCGLSRWLSLAGSISAT